MNTIGILTSGGDAPGMNAAIRGVVRSARYYDIKVKGIRKGYNGLIYGDMYDMDASSVSDILQRGGTILQTARCKDFKDPDVIHNAIKTARYFGIEGLVVIGGDGSFRGARDLSLAGMPTIGIPGTIDNDMPYTEYTIGYDTAINTAKEAVDRIRDTASSHERCNIIEVMGRESGSIALAVGISTGAESILIPEIPYSFEEDILYPINMGKKRNKRHFIVILAEGVGGGNELAKRIETETGVETRLTTLGYQQRGGSPTVRDRMIASQMGSKAVDLLKDGITNRIIGIKNNQIYDIDIVEGLDIQPKSPDELLKIAKMLSV